MNKSEGKENKRDMAQLTTEEKLAQATEAFKQIESAKTADEVRNVFRNTYATLGHKVLGRMVLGQNPEKALRLNSTKE